MCCAAGAYAAADPACCFAELAQLRDGILRQLLPEVCTHQVLHEASTVPGLERTGTGTHAAPQDIESEVLACAATSHTSATRCSVPRGCYGSRALGSLGISRSQDNICNILCETTCTGRVLR